MRRRRLSRESDSSDASNSNTEDGRQEESRDFHQELPQGPLSAPFGDPFIEELTRESMSDGQLQLYEMSKQHTSNPVTFNKSLELINAGGESKVSRTLKSKELGLGVGLIAAAETQVHRLAQLQKTLMATEERLSYLASQGFLENEDLLEFYKIMISNVERSGKFIADVGKTVKWDAIKQELLELETLQEKAGDVDEKEIQMDAVKMLRRFTEMQQAGQIEDAEYTEIPNQK